MSNTDFYPIIKYPSNLEIFAQEHKKELWKIKVKQQSRSKKKYLVISSYKVGKTFNIIVLFFGFSLIVFLRLSLVWLLASFAIFIATNYWLNDQLRADNITQRRTTKKNLQLFDPSQQNNPSLSLSLVSHLKSHPPLEGIGISASQRGVSEAFFLNYLEQFLPSAEINWKMEFAIPRKVSCYSVDFVVVEPQTRLSLIIEIDEPYVSKSRFESYHDLDNSEDYQRDKFFLTQNLIVLRFAEEQIVRYPRSCCLTIANILWQLTDNSEYWRANNQIKPLPLIKRWTSFQARQMWKRNYRQKYLAETGVAYFSPSEYKFARRYQKSGIKKIPRW